MSTMDSAVEAARRDMDWLKAYAQSSFTTIDEADRLHSAANTINHLISSQSQVERMREVHAFLLGEGPLDGRWFGDNPPRTKSGRPRPYWWRDQLRAALNPKGEK